MANIEIFGTLVRNDNNTNRDKIVQAAQVEGGYFVCESLPSTGTWATGQLCYVAGTVNKFYKYSGTAWVETSLINQNAFSTIVVDGQNNVAADSITGTVTFAGSNVTITTDSDVDKVTFSVAEGDTMQKGIVQLSSVASPTEEAMAATPKGVQTAINALDFTAPSVPNTGTTTATAFIDSVSQTNGKITATKKNLPNYSEKTFKLEEDLYTYTPIGFAQRASNMDIDPEGSTISLDNPCLLGAKGASLKTVFNKIFGTESVLQPTINANNVKLTIEHNPSTTTYNGTGNSTEFGKTVAGVSEVTYTIKFSNSATAQYGYKYGNTETKTADATFYYPAKKNYNSSKAQLKITLPSNQTASSSMVTEGEYVAHSSNILYCNFSSSKIVKFKVSLAESYIQTSSQTRYGQVSAEVTLGTAQTEDTNNALPVEATATDKIISSFLAYRPVEKSYEESTVVVDGTNIDTDGKISKSKSAITISAGYVPYAWVLADSAVAADGDLPVTNTSSSAYTSIYINNADGNKYLYIYVPADKTIDPKNGITNNNQSAPATTIETGRSLKVNGHATKFNIYQVNAKVAPGENNYTITYN